MVYEKKPQMEARGGVKPFQDAEYQTKAKGSSHY